MKKVKIFLRTHDKAMQKATKGVLEGKDYVDVVVEDIANAEEKMVDVAIIGLDNPQGKPLADRLREVIPGIKIVPFYSQYVDYGDVNTVCTDIGRLDEIIAGLLKTLKILVLDIDSALGPLAERTFSDLLEENGVKNEITLASTFKEIKEKARTAKGDEVNAVIVGEVSSYFGEEEKIAKMLRDEVPKIIIINYFLRDLEQADLRIKRPEGILKANGVEDVIKELIERMEGIKV